MHGMERNDDGGEGGEEEEDCRSCFAKLLRPDVRKGEAGHRSDEGRGRDAAGAGQGRDSAEVVAGWGRTGCGAVACTPGMAGSH